MNNQVELPSLYFFKKNYLDFEKVHDETRLAINDVFRQLNIRASAIFLEASLGFMKFRISVMADEDFPIFMLEDYTETIEALSNSLGVPVVSYFGSDILEVPYNRERRKIPYFSDLDLTKLRDSSMALPILLGMESETDYSIGDLARFPHLLIAGQTGSGKSNWINSMLLSLLLNFKPDELKLILIDPKVVELSVYNDIPHLLLPVITEAHKVNNALAWCIDEMKRRYQLLAKMGVNNIIEYNETAETNEKLPYIVVVIDEFVDLMALSNHFQELVCHLCRKAKAAGIHLIMSTQRPASNVITEIKAHIYSRIAFTVASNTDSEMILGCGGAECLIGQGDLLFRGHSTSCTNGFIQRNQAVFTQDEDVKRIVKYWSNQGKPHYIELPEYEKEPELPDNELDPLFEEAIQFVRETNRLAISAIQRQFYIGFNRAARIMDQLEQQGIVSKGDNSGRRYLL